MKTRIKLNEEQQGLKPIQVNDGFLVVDLQNKPIQEKLYEWVYNLQTQDISNIGEIDNYDVKIIFATPNLNLEGVPVIEYDSSISRLVCSEFKEEFELMQESMPSIWFDVKLKIIKLLKQAQQNLFTEEQVREAIVKSALSKTDFLPNRCDEVIQSLKQPTVEITFKNNEPIKCIML